MILLAGRAAEDLIFGSDYITTGAYGDLKESTKMVTNMLTSFGMGKSLGLLTLAELNSINYNADSNIINEGKEILNSLYNDAKKILSENMKSLEKLADELLIKETIHYDDILNILEN
jgi:cell division protease FtsH